MAVPSARGPGLSGNLGHQLCAVAGISLLFPGQPGFDGFWSVASGNGDVQSEVPFSRWDIDTAFSPDVRPGKMLASTRSA